MYGKSFESQYDGSMVGAGLHVYGVWNYCIAKNRAGVIELNPKLLAFVFGCTEGEVSRGIEYLCAKDPKSRSKDEGGRRLVREGEYQYRMVNWEKYDAMRNTLDRREYNRIKQRQYRYAKRIDKV